MLQVGDKVWMIATRSSLMQKRIMDVPLERKIIQVIERPKKNDVLYQLKGDSFPESWLGTYVFTDKEVGERAISARYTRIILNGLDRREHERN